MEVKELKLNGRELLIGASNPIIIAGNMYTGKHDFMNRGAITDVPNVYECKIFDEENCILFSFTAQYMEGPKYMDLIESQCEASSDTKPCGLIGTHDAKYTEGIIRAYHENRSEILIIDANPLTLIHLQELKIPFYIAFPMCDEVCFEEYVRRACRRSPDIKKDFIFLKSVWDAFYELYLGLDIPSYKKILMDQNGYIQHVIGCILKSLYVDRD